jgi:hypothetical protein
MSNLLSQASLVMIPSGYKEDVVYSQVPTDGSGDLSFTRASDGARINSAGLVEVVPWNLFQQSENFPNAIWTKSTLTFNSTVTAPNGTSTAQNYSTAGAYSYVLQTITVSSGEYYTVSCYLKYTSGVGSISIGYTDAPSNNFIRVDANLINGTIGSVSYGGNGANGTATITSVGDGWYRVTVSGTLTIGNAGLIVSNLALGATTFSIWGAQLNIGSTAKPYFPTTDRLNVPRLTYQNGGGGCPSLLLEKQSTNYVKYSEDFMQSDWLKSGATITANSIISPDGTQNATRVQFSAGSRYLYQSITGVPAGSVTISCYIKGASVQNIGFSDGNANPNQITLTTEWQRYTFTFTYSSGGIGIQFDNYFGVMPNQESKDFYIWGAQLEQSSYATSLINTTSASATRVADACFKTGISSLIGQSQGTLFADVDLNHTSVGNTYILQIFQDSSNRILLYRSSGDVIGCYILKASGSVYDTTSGSSYTGRTKIAFAYKSGDIAFYINGTQIGTSSATYTAFASLADLNIDSNNGTERGYYNYNQVIVFPTRLTNAELASLTTI